MSPLFTLFSPARLRLPLRFVFFLLLALTGVGSEPWPHETGDVPPDPTVRWGRLDNGLRYAIRPNAEPAGRVYLILQVAVGSIHERDDQRGYAHFVEHMMFRGTKRYPATSLVNFLQHEGLAMGADSSAFTNYTTTFYNLDLPKNTPEKITLGLSIFRDFADGAVIAAKEVKREAKVIASERRTRLSSVSDVGEALSAYLYPDSLITRRLPIGTLESIEAATSEKLLEFYRTWYRPSRFTLIAVGDADPDLLERLIREQFSSLKPATPRELPDPDFNLRVTDDVQARFFANPVVGGTSNILYALAAQAPEPDTIVRRRQQVAENASFGIFNARLADIARQRATDIGQAEAGWTLEFGRMRQAYVRIDTRNELWRAGLRLGEQELRRALLHGFTPDEVKLQSQGFQNALQEGVRTAASRPSPALAQSIRAALEHRYVFTSPETDLDIAASAAADLTPENTSAAFRTFWTPPNRRVAVIGSYPTPLTDAEVRTAYEDSAFATFFTGQDARAIEPFDYTHFGAPGTIKRRTRDDRIDAHAVLFTNGVRANLKVTDYEKGRVYLRLRLGRGMMSEPADKPGLSAVAEGTYVGGGLGRYDNVELGRRLAGDTLTFNFTIEEDGFYFTGFCGSDKVERLLQVITAFITDPGFRKEGFENSVSRLQSYYPTVTREPTNFLRAVCPTIVASGDLRYGLIPPDQSLQRTPQEIEAWLRPVLAEGAMEIGLAGDFELDATIQAVARTLGALPKRGVDPKPDPARRPVLPAVAINQTWTLESSEPHKAAVRVYWPGVDDDDFRTSRRLQVLGEILNDRLRVKIREELGATYGPLESVWGSNVWPGYGYLIVEIETSPALAERVATLTKRIASDIARKGITADEFQRVIEPRLASLQQELRNNSYWTHHVLCRMQETPSRISWPLTRNSDYQTMLKKEVEEVARRSFGSTRVYTFIARPK